MMNLTNNDTATSAIGAASLILIIIIAIIGNILLLVSIKNVRRSLPGVLVLVLSLCDLSFSTLVLPISAVAFLMDWNMEDTPSACGFQGSMSFALKFTSTFTVCLISLERYFYVKPSEIVLKKQCRPIGRSVIACGSCLLISLLLGSMPLIGGIGMKTFEDSLSYCHFDITPDDTISTIFSIIVLSIAYIMLQISMFSLVSVFCNWNSYVKVQLRSNSHMNQNGTHGESVVQTSFKPNSSTDLNQRLSFTRMLLVICVLHWCCHMPFLLLIAVTLMSGSFSQTADFVTVYIMALQPALTPIAIFSLYPPYFRNMKSQLFRKSNNMPTFNHQPSDESSRYRDASQFGSYQRNVSDIQISLADTSKESFSNHNLSYDDVIRRDSSYGTGLTYSNDDVIGVNGSSRAMSDVKIGLRRNEPNGDGMIGIFNDGYYDSDSVSCSTCSRSDFSYCDDTEGFDSDFSEYSYSTDEGHRGIVYLNRVSRKVVLTRVESVISHKTDTFNGQYLSPCDVSRASLSDREPEQLKVTEHTPPISTNTPVDVCDTVKTELTRIPRNIYKGKVGNSDSKHQIIGRRELRRFGIKTGRLTETFTRESIPKETSLFKLTSGRRQNICLVCQGPFARRIPHAKHKLHQEDMTTVKTKFNCKKESRRSKDPSSMNVLFQKALYEHSQSPGLQLKVEDGAEADNLERSKRLSNPTKRRSSHEDIQYRQYIRFIASLHNTRSKKHDRHKQSVGRNESQSSVCKRGDDNQRHPERHEKEKKDQSLPGVSYVESNMDNDITKDQAHRRTIDNSLQRHTSPSTSSDTNLESLVHGETPDKNTKSNSMLTNKPVIQLQSFDSAKSSIHGDLNGKHQATVGILNIPKIEVTDLSTSNNESREVIEETFNKFLLKLRDAQTKLNPHTPIQ
ncbi:uncharacterized protein [Antedon mediterranea]|uniref:uncharacterized protein n=1 Tax=Antedon mediterranea TaxID=105859 RepID=UPI003AF47280